MTAPHTHDERCREVFALLSQYLDFELPPGACEQIETHIAGCPPCVEFMESLRMTVELCRQYKPSEFPEPLREETRTQLRAAWRKMRANQQQGAGD